MAENTASETRRGFWDNFFNKTFPPESQALMGMLSFFGIILITAYVGFTEVPRMDKFTSEYDARSIQRGAALFDANCARCHGDQGQGNPGIAPALNNPDLFNGNRLAELEYAGSVRNFVQLTIAAGRPARSGNYPDAMPTWSQEYGGPMRPDQVVDLTNFVMNWACQHNPDCVSEEDGGNLPTPLPTSTPGPTPTIDPAAAPVGDTALADLPEGDPTNGEALYNSSATDITGTPLGCQACHSLDGTAGVGPSFTGIGERVPEGYDSVEAYIHESILDPNAHVREGFAADIMPKNFGERITGQMLADLIAFISGQ